ncbi:hypothetical protein CYY_000591 [Polysphondylium violaceum]|uniref:Uncharacterized protein n=1 Tax=Polysphondylium violaceum TaxID=133409 RepID=A0A8J4V2A6_9MYCE|nr:hypothetical protein CYY_000591 [Polysphondylium violaceum]
MDKLFEELLKHPSTRVLKLLKIDCRSRRIEWEHLYSAQTWGLCFLKEMLASIHDQRTQMPTELLQRIVKNSSYANAKHVLSNYRFESIAPILSTLAHRDSPVMVDLVYQYRDTAFINTPTQQDWESLFKKCIRLNSSHGTIANIDYLVNHPDHILSCPIPKDMNAIDLTTYQPRFTDAPSDKLEICRQILNQPIPEYLSSHIESYYFNNKDDS